MGGKEIRFNIFQPKNSINSPDDKEPTETVSKTENSFTAWTSAFIFFSKVGFENISEYLFQTEQWTKHRIIIY
jgi:hypothetical protein